MACVDCVLLCVLCVTRECMGVSVEPAAKALCPIAKHARRRSAKTQPQPHPVNVPEQRPRDARCLVLSDAVATCVAWGVLTCWHWQALWSCSYITAACKVGCTHPWAAGTRTRPALSRPAAPAAPPATAATRAPAARRRRRRQPWLRGAWGKLAHCGVEGVGGCCSRVAAKRLILSSTAQIAHSAAAPRPSWLPMTSSAGPVTHLLLLLGLRARAGASACGWCSAGVQQRAVRSVSARALRHAVRRRSSGRQPRIANGPPGLSPGGCAARAGCRGPPGEPGSA